LGFWRPRANRQESQDHAGAYRYQGLLRAAAPTNARSVCPLAHRTRKQGAQTVTLFRLMQHAQSYAHGNCAVFPLSHTSKAPLTRHGFKDATTDQQQIRDWWARYPRANIGIRCDWFFAVDIDPRNGGDAEWRDMLTAHGESYPVTWESATGSGGSHFFFHHDSRLDDVPLGKWTNGIDIKGGSRGYVVAPPSVHPGTGRRYGWVLRPRDTPLAKAPEWLIERIVSDKRPPVTPAPVVPISRDVDRVRQAEIYARKFDPAVSGQNGHSHTFWVVQRVVRGFALSDSEAYSILSVWNQSCQPPWSERELRRKISEVRRKGSLAEGALLR
jgi:hypothetical protein